MSKRLNALRREIKRLRMQFLPDPFDPLANYPDPERVQAHTRAFLVLSHAEVESYLETWAKEMARAAEDVWQNHRRMTPPLGFLIASLGERLDAVQVLSKGKVDDSHKRFGDLVNRLFTRYYSRIKDNHGVKENNVLSLLEPLGVSAAAFSNTLLPNLDSFGARRGSHAHYAAAVVAVLDPETEFQRAETILNDLALLDSWLVAYKRRVR